MQVFDKRGIARPAAKMLAAIGAVLAVLLAITVSALPARAASSGSTYRVRVILSGKSLHHWYTKAGSSKRYREALTQPDDITRIGRYLFTGFQNGVGPQGQASTDGNRDSTIAEFTAFGTVVNQWDIRGKCDGLTANPATGLVVATVNEDANSSLYTINPFSGRIVHYHYNRQPLPHNGGTDAISFYRGLMLISASAPGTVGAPAPQPYYPAVYVVTLNQFKRVAYVQALFFGESHATAANGTHVGHPVKLGLTDPDSNEVVPAVAPRFSGDFMLTSQGDKEQIYVHGAGTRHHHLWVLALSQSVDDTAWATSLVGALFATDHDADTVNVVLGFFRPGTAFVAVTPCDANGAPATCPAPGFPANYLGTLNMFTGKITLVSTSGVSLHPQGMIFASA
jgi:hypothetical protein